MRIEDHRIARRDDVEMLPLSVGMEWVRGRDGAHDAKGRVFLQRDAVVAAAAIGMQPLDARHQLDDLQLLDLVVQPADLRFFQFDPAPLGGIGLGEGL